jgi:hypothetical protein
MMLSSSSNNNRIRPVKMRTQLVAAATLAAALQPAAAITQATALSIFAIAQVIGSVLFAWLGIKAERDFFLLLGCVCADWRAPERALLTTPG